MSATGTPHVPDSQTTNSKDSPETREEDVSVENGLVALSNYKQEDTETSEHNEDHSTSSAPSQGAEGAETRAVEGLSQQMGKAGITSAEDSTPEKHGGVSENLIGESSVYAGIELLGAKPAEMLESGSPIPAMASTQLAEAELSNPVQDSTAFEPTRGSETISAQKKAEKAKESASEEVIEDDSRSEIQSIMEQFEGQDENEQAVGDAFPEDNDPQTHHPPRHSSLHSQRPDITSSPTSNPSRQIQAIGSPIKPHSARNVSFSQPVRSPSGDQAIQSPLQSPALNKALPPAPDPEPDLPFDFHRFLEQLRHRTADSVAKYLRSFLQEFGKKQWMVHEQVKIISDFLVFIANKMALCDVWRGVSDAEFDNAREGMEKLVMNRLYSQTFSPSIPPPTPISPQKGKSRNPPRHSELGRRGQHQEDVERDEVLAQKVRIYGWVREEHLDIAPVGKTGQRFLTLAQQELLKIKSYRAPRDKVICVLNCCKVIFGLLRNSKDADTSADAFVPLLIYVILRANPEHLVSNVQYISRFRNPEKLGGEAGYYLSSLMGAVQFIENLDRTALTISNEEFEKNVEAAVSAIAERKSIDVPTAELPASIQQLAPRDPEKVGRGPRSSSEQRHRTKAEASSASTPGTTPGDQTPVGGLLKSIQKPLSSIGRMFSEEPGAEAIEKTPHRTTNLADDAPRLSPAVFQPPRRSSEIGTATSSQGVPSPNLPAADAAARQASVETAEAQRIQRAEHQTVVDTLVGMFPNLDREVISDVVRMKEGRVGSAVDACLAMNG